MNITLTVTRADGEFTTTLDAEFDEAIKFIVVLNLVFSDIMKVNLKAGKIDFNFVKSDDSGNLEVSGEVDISEYNMPSIELNIA